MATYRLGAGAARLLPDGLTAAVGSMAGALAARAMGARRDQVERNLRRIRPDLSDAALDRLAQRAVGSYVRYWVESFRLPSLTAAQLDARMSFVGMEHIEAGMAAGTGAIMALPHLGGWDFGGAWLCTTGYPITVVVEPLEPPELFDWFVGLRSAIGMTVVPAGPGASGAVLGALRDNRLVGLLCDRDLAGTGVEVEFFGERTTLPGGPATLALRTGAPLCPTAVYFEGSRSHRGVVCPPLPVERRGTLREDVARITQEVAHALEDLIAKAPDQWHLFQPNWPSDPGYAADRRDLSPGRPNSSN